MSVDWAGVIFEREDCGRDIMGTCREEMCAVQLGA